MNPQDLIIRKISLNNFINERVVKYVSLHPFLFAKERMADPNDDRPIRIKYFGTFVQKKTMNKENVKKLNEILQLIRFHEDHYINVFQGLFKDKKEIIEHIKNCFKSADMSEFEETYNIIVNNKCKQTS